MMLNKYLQNNITYLIYKIEVNEEVMKKYNFSNFGTSQSLKGPS